ncbi:MAG: alpha/beta hydrolase [Candidatus Lambdaproteobacteria bacterium]|nr:alpha/beta hydrolase [Candidatus Lambdaproteobacteria bacterium]
MPFNPYHYPEYRVDGLYVMHAPSTASAARSRPPLLLIHGASHGAWCWELWMRELPGLGWHSHALSLRGHAGSTPFPGGVLLQLTLGDYLDDVCRVLAHVGRPCVLIGHSMGGLIAQATAAWLAQSGQPAAALVLLASAEPAPARNLFAEPLPLERPFPPSKEFAAQRYFHDVEPAVLADALARLGPESPTALNQLGTGQGYAVDVGAITCPVLVVTAEHDRSIAPADRTIADRYAGADYLHIAGQGHDLMLERGWSTTLGRVADWLQRKVG